MSDEKNWSEVDQMPKAYSDHDIHLSQIVIVSILYLFMWVIYFVVFHGARLLQEAIPDDWYQILIVLQKWTISSGLMAPLMFSTILLAIPLICAAIFGAVTASVRLSKAFISLLVLVAIFSAIPSVFELVFENRQVGFWKFSLVAFPPVCTVGLLLGRLFRKFVSKSKLN